MKLAKTFFGKGAIAHCCSHRFQLAPKDVFSHTSDSLKKVIAACRTITVASRRSTKFSELLNRCEVNRLQWPGDTRWNSLYLLAESMTRRSNAVIYALQEAQRMKVELDTDAVALMTKQDTYVLLKAFVKLMKPMKELTDIFGRTKHVSMALVPATMQALILHLQHFSKNCHPLTGHLRFLSAEMRDAVWNELRNETHFFGIDRYFQGPTINQLRDIMEKESPGAKRIQVCICSSCVAVPYRRQTDTRFVCFSNWRNNMATMKSTAITTLSTMSVGIGALMPSAGGGATASIVSFTKKQLGSSSFILGFRLARTLRRVETRLLVVFKTRTWEICRTSPCRNGLFCIPCSALIQIQLTTSKK